MMFACWLGGVTGAASVLAVVIVAVLGVSAWEERHGWPPGHLLRSFERRMRRLRRRALRTK